MGGLGKGLDSLLDDGLVDNILGAASTIKGSDSMLISEIQPGAIQPRYNIAPEPLQELADSIKANGVLQPIIVRPLTTGGYELVAGERRWRASQIAGLKKIPTIIKDISDDQALIIALIENIQRQNLNSVEQAQALKRLRNEHKMSQQEIATMLGISRPQVANLLRLLQLSGELLDMVRQGELSEGHARTLLAAPKSRQHYFAIKVRDEGLSVRQTEQLVKNHTRKKRPAKTTATHTALSPDMSQLRRELADQLGAAVDIRYLEGKGGELALKFATLDELDGILERMGVTLAS